MREQRTALILLLILCFVMSPLPRVRATEDSWESKAPMHQGRAYLGVAAVNGKIYAIGGDNGQNIGTGPPLSFTSHVVNTTEMYDPASDTWTLKASMPTPRSGFGVAVYQNKIYCIGGWTHSGIYNNGTGANEVYDPATNKWETKSPMPTVPAADRLVTASVVNDKIYVIAVNAERFVREYDPLTDLWTTKTPPPHYITSFVSFVIDDKIYTIGSDSGNFFEIYDPATDSWSFGASSQVAGLSLTAAETTGVNASKRIYFFDRNQTKVYDPLSSNWVKGTAMPTDRVLAKALAVDDSIYLLGGRTGEMGFISITYPTAVNEQYTTTEVIPEFPSWMFLPLFVTATLAVMICRNRLRRKVS
jgi:N-acetylneuraminic acid mutarotase